MKRNSRYWASTVCHEKSAVDESYKERLVAAYREELTPHEKHAFTYLMLKRNSRYWASTVCHEKSAVDESYKERLVAAYREELTPHEKHAFTYLMLKRNSRYWASTVCHETIVQCVADIQNHNVQPIHSHHTVGGS